MPASGTIKTAHMTIKGAVVHCGGTWVEIPTTSRGPVNQWLRRLRQ
jgi:hypothetical protein